MDMGYHVRFIGDDQLDKPWALVRDADGDYWFFVRESDVTPATLEDAWRAYAAMSAPHARRLVAVT